MAQVTKASHKRWIRSILEGQCTPSVTYVVESLRTVLRDDTDWVPVEHLDTA